MKIIIRMIRNYNLRNLFVLQRYLTAKHSKSTSAIDITKLEQESALELDVVDQEAQLREEAIQRKRNKSRLNDAHRNILLDAVPYREPKHWSHTTLKYHRKLYGKYGKASGVNPELCWPTKEELVDRIEYERIAYPFTIPEMMESAKRKKEEKELEIEQRQKHIAEKLSKLDEWTRELKMKIAKKETEAREAKERKEKLVEEVRRHFGYTVDPRDDRFKEMLEKKEKEQRKALKEARKKAKEEKIVVKILNKSGDTTVEDEPKTS